MPITKTISSLRYHAKDIAALCREQNIPVYLTHNGDNELVVVSVDHYEQLKAQAELFEKLGEAQSQSARGERGITHKQMMTKLRRRVNAS